MLFSPLPTHMEQLETALQQADAANAKPPPPFVDIGRKLRVVYERQRAQNYQFLGKSEWRQLPYALWLKDLPTLQETDPELVQRYWTEVLPEALRTTPRRAKRWLMPLFFIYCEAFDPAAGAFLNYAARLRQALIQAEGTVAAKLRDIDARQDFFAPTRVPANLATLFLTQHGTSIEVLFEDYLLWPRFTDTRLGAAILHAGLNLSPDHLRQQKTISRILDWLEQMPAPVVKTALRIDFANALLLPWWPLRKMDNGLKKLLLDFFLRTYGDPHVPRQAHYQWDGVAPHALTVMRHILTGETLRGFMEILARTADDIWRYRQKFWTAYYDQGHIEEAWLVLGSDAQAIIASQDMNPTSRRHGRLEGASANQSVLLLRIGSLIFAEWSHNGSLRAYHENDSYAPKLYQLSYHSQELRDAQSLDFHEGLNMRPELRHTHSDAGTWQRKARDMIRRHTGVHIHDQEILMQL